MQSLVAAWESAGDRRAIFLNCYLLMTRNMLAALEAGDFRDRRWVDALLRHFAGYYFAALEAYEADKMTAPAVWVRAHDAAGRDGPWVVQLLMLGVNAHINYDLVLALVDMLDESWATLPAETRRARREDFDTVNAIIARTINTVQDDVVEQWAPAMDWVDKGMGRLDEWLTVRLITGWRDEVWAQAVRMLETPPEQRPARRSGVEASTLQRADAILLEGFPATARRLWLL
jgi:hypothetical protein